jgi:MFS family permease
MATVGNEDTELIPSPQQIVSLEKLSWKQLITISLFWFALNFHWAALGIIILPSQVFKLVGPLHQGESLAFVLVPGAFVALFANPLFGMLSDQMHGRMAGWGRRRPYILIGTLVNVVGLVWMAFAPDIPTLTLAYILVQFASNAAQAPFHALLPDLVPSQQRGLASGVMGVLTIGGNIGGIVVAGLFVDATKPSLAYQHSLWLIYGLIIAVMLVLMLVTIATVREKAGFSARSALDDAILLPTPTLTPGTLLPAWLKRSSLYTIGGTLLIIALLWGLIQVWNGLHLTSIQINAGVQQVLLELIATLGILRLFDFQPRRNPNFAWVFVTRLLMMLGIYTIQTFLQYYMRDVVHAAHPELATTNFAVIVSITSLVSALGVGWLSDRYGRKLMVYLSGAFMGLVGLVFVLTHSLPLIILAGAIFGLGYGAYQSVDWALVADVLPSERDYARDMGVWSISLAVPQIIAPVLGGPLIDTFTRNGQTVLGYQLLFIMAIIYCVLGTVTVRYIRGVK